MVKRSGKLNGLQSRVENGAKIGLILSGDLIAENAQGRVHVISGDLKRSLERGNPFVTSKGMAISIGSDVEYAETEETREGTRDGTPHTYLRPALHDSRDEAIRLVGKNVVAKMVGR